MKQRQIAKRIARQGGKLNAWNDFAGEQPSEAFRKITEIVAGVTCVGKKKSKQIDFQTERYLVRNRVEKKQETDKQTNLLLFKSYVS